MSFFPSFFVDEIVPRTQRLSTLVSCAGALGRTVHPRKRARALVQNVFLGLDLGLDRSVLVRKLPLRMRFYCLRYAPFRTLSGISGRVLCPCTTRKERVGAGERQVSDLGGRLIGKSTAFY